MTTKASPCTRRLVSALVSPESLSGLSLREWDELLRLARQANLLARLAEAMARQTGAPAVPRQVRVHLDAARTLARHQRDAIGWEARHIGEALGSLGVPLVLLKGAAYAVAGLPAALGRLFGDVDLLVPREALSQVEAGLMLHGWSADYHDDYDARYYRRWMHELPPMVHRQRGTVIDVHHNILPLTARAVPDAAKLLAAAVPIPGTPFHVLSPPDMVLHSATHLFHEGELRNGLRDLLDLDALLRDFSAADPAFCATLPGRAAELRLERPLYYALRFLTLVLGTPVPADVLDRVTAQACLSPLARRLMDAVYLQALEPEHPLCNRPAGAAARAWVYLRGHLLRMPPGLLLYHLGRKTIMRLYKNTSRGV